MADWWLIRRDWRLSLDRLGEICEKTRKIDGLVRKMGTLVKWRKTALKCTSMFLHD